MPLFPCISALLLFLINFISSSPSYSTSLLLLYFHFLLSLSPIPPFLYNSDTILAEQLLAPSDATQLRLQILISLDDRTDDQAIRKQQVVPGLYFILDGQAYIVNHTLISKISFPQHSSGSQEPPSACIGGNNEIVGLALLN